MSLGLDGGFGFCDAKNIYNKEGADSGSVLIGNWVEDTFSKLASAKAAAEQRWFDTTTAGTFRPPSDEFREYAENSMPPTGGQYHCPKEPLPKHLLFGHGLQKESLRSSDSTTTYHLTFSEPSEGKLRIKESLEHVSIPDERNTLKLAKEKKWAEDRNTDPARTHYDQQFVGQGSNLLTKQLEESSYKPSGEFSKSTYHAAYRNLKLRD